MELSLGNLADFAEVEKLLCVLKNDSRREVDYLFFKCVFEALQRNSTSVSSLCAQLRKQTQSEIVIKFVQGWLLFHKGERKSSRKVLEDLYGILRVSQELSLLETVSLEEGLLLLSKILLDDKKLDNGLCVVEFLCLSNSKFLRGWELYGDYLTKRHNTKDATSCYERCQDIGPAVLYKLASGYCAEGMYMKCVNLYLCHDSIMVRDEIYDLCKSKLFMDIHGL